MFPKFPFGSQAAFLPVLISLGHGATDTFSPFLLNLAQQNDAKYPDKMRALCVFALMRLLRGGKARPQPAVDFAKKVIAVSLGSPVDASATEWKVGHCLKFASAAFLAMFLDVEEEGAVVAPFLDVMRVAKAARAAWREHRYPCPWVTFRGDPWSYTRWLEKHRNDEFSFVHYTIEVLSETLSHATRTSHVFPALLEYFKSKHLFAGTLLVSITFSHAIPKEAYFADLSSPEQTVVRALLAEPEMWVESSRCFVPPSELERLNLPRSLDALTKFVNTSLPEELAQAKRFVSFQGLDDIPWATVGHAYGSAEDMPGLIRSLGSTDPKIRKGAFSGLYSAPYHQGTVYSATPYVATWLLKLLEYQMQGSKGPIISWLTTAAVSWPSEFVYRRFAESDRLPDEDEKGIDGEFHFGPDAVRDTYNAVKAGLPIIVHLLKTSTETDVRTCAIHLLSFFPAEKSRTLALAFELLQAPPSDEAVHASLLLLVSGFTLPTDAAFPGFVDKLVSLWKDASQHKFVRRIATFCHARMLQDTIEPLPEDLKLSLVHFTGSSGDYPGDGDRVDWEAWPWGDGLIGRVLQARKNEFVDVFIDQLKSCKAAEEAKAVSEALLGCVFETPNGGRYGGNSRIPDWYDFRGSQFDAGQLAALRAIADCDLCWLDALDNEGIIKAREKAENSSFFRGGSPLQNRLHNLLELSMAVTRTQLQISLQKLAELPALSKDDLASGTITKYNCERFLDAPE